MLTGDDPLPRRPDRVLVAGTSGSGKTTLAARIAGLLDIPHTEIDALYHGPNWVPRKAFEGDVDAFTRKPRWVTEWQYGAVRELLATRAELLVWLDLSRTTVMSQVVSRTLRRRVRRQVLWNGNVEPPLWTFFTDPEHVVRWAWGSHARNADRIPQLLRRHPRLIAVRLTSRDEVSRWLAGPLTSAVAGDRGTEPR